LALHCFKCNQEVVFDSDHIGKNGKKIPLDPATHTPHDCPMREKTAHGQIDTRGIEDKDDHGNEGFPAPPEQMKQVDLYLETKGVKPEYVDHTAVTKGQSKVKIFEDRNKDVVEDQYNQFLVQNNGKIKTQGAQFQMTNETMAIALYYEEVK
jgi:hypothetical protein